MAKTKTKIKVNEEVFTSSKPILPDPVVPQTRAMGVEAPQTSNTSAHETEAIPVRDPVFYQVVPVGRGSGGSGLTLDNLNKLYDGWSIGCDDVEAAALIHVSPDVIKRVLKEFPEMVQVKMRAQAEPRVLAKKNVYKRLNNDSTGDYSLKYLEKVKPEEFGGKGAVINISNTTVSVSDKTTSLTEFMGTFGADIIDEDTLS